jgi:hypothetical protein
MPANVVATGAYKQISATGNVLSHQCELLGIFVSAAASTPTITVYDSASTATTTKIVDTFTPVAGTWYKLPFTVTQGLYIVISGTVSATVSVL